ncbi:cysteine desulfurase family protein [Glutamicibacter protophormiae]|uniref:Cysteine desulfurase n=1 Tax=Glutamicibacter protophormiae TaxID=37930 RepID=A0ABS4XUG2_GLUPR|nr:cysteine desulfurase family protein [Glutamicibacter protophormiae]MBP2400163.1 cysteine desulfurase [Glutamicibacter protophormiae]GGL74791.1 cysteine desulfurase [Glutamicibacter protophormiae]
MNTSAVYLDHAATTDMTPAALAAITAQFAATGNPSSLHTAGRRANRVVDDARIAIAAAAGAHSSELIFTSGGTESDNLALKGLFWNRVNANPAARMILVSGIEHHAVLDTVTWLAEHEQAELCWMPVDADGVLDLQAVRALLEEHHEHIALGTIMWANNEVGTVQPVPEFAALLAGYGIPAHSDAVQAFGAVPTNFADSKLAAMSISAHKIGGPVGIGGLLVRRDVALMPVQHGGGHERKMRSGTLNAAAAAGFAAAATEVADHLAEEAARLSGLREYAVQQISQLVPEAVLNGPRDAENRGTRLPGNLHFTFPECEGDSLLFVLDMLGIASSTGSACTAGVPQPSHVLLAMGRDARSARSVQRFTLGHRSTRADVDALLEALPQAYERARKAGMAADESSIHTAGTGFTR